MDRLEAGSNVLPAEGLHGVPDDRAETAVSAAGKNAQRVGARGEGYTLGELQQYWEQTHQQIAREQDAESAIVEAHPRLVNLFDDFAHRLGMRTNFRWLGRLEGRRVLDLGCGRGRWAQEFARRGAQVTGVDWSAEALEQARRRVPQGSFVRMPITKLEFQPRSFEVVNCVTVVQHLPHDAQASVLHEAARILAPGGMLSLVELIAAEPGPHVFPRTAAGWVELAHASGLRPLSIRGCNYELLFRPYKAVMIRLRAGQANASTAAGVGAQTGLSWRQKVNRLMMSALALPSFPAEMCSLALPVGAATHAAMVFQLGDTPERN
jgi:2-polyprenyl-3-methyl-5-hydroxy-6-metoxy-1,4-benzoquinol methylase